MIAIPNSFIKLPFHTDDTIILDNCKCYIYIRQLQVEEEIFQALKILNGDKALGLDGYTMANTQVFWSVIREFLVTFLKYFHKSNMFEKGLNATFIALHEC